VDNDPARYTVELLRTWRHQAEELAFRSIGQSNPAGAQHTQDAEREIQRKLDLRAALEKTFLRPAEERLRLRSKHPYAKFRISEAIIRSLSDRFYPEVDETPGISNWFKVELFDFYHNGLEVILSIRPGAIRSDGAWRLLTPDEALPQDGTWREVDVWELGCIPYRNIRAYDLRGDEYYNFPHLYCAFADEGEPYEEIRYAIVAADNEYDWPLEPSQRLH
jgi:hypothetical protein